MAYTYEEAKKDCLNFFNNDELATDVFLKKYAVMNNDGLYEEKIPSDMWKRMAKAAAHIEKDKEKWEKEFYEIFSNFHVIPGGSIMFALGNKYARSSLSNCFVMDLDDSLEDIFDTAKRMARTYSYRGGCGIDISKLRPVNAQVSNAAKTSSGSISFMELYSYVTRLIGMHGRRGALMISMSIDHPDIEQFIKEKRNKDRITGANLSVRLTNKFMKAVEKNEEWITQFNTKHEIVERKWKARELWNLIIDSATKYAEPGILFWDNIKKYNPSEAYIEDVYGVCGVNPCSELSLSKNEACLLVSINLAKYTINDFTDKAFFDFNKFTHDAIVATRFADNCKTIDADLVPLKEQKAVALALRRIGMGITGLADCLANLRIKYDSDDAIKFIDKLFKTYTKTVYQASVDLGKEKGVFPVFDAKKEKGHYFLEKIGFAGVARRNVACLTVAPTGSVSVLAQCSSGIEPVFRNAYSRRVKLNPNMKVDEHNKVVEDDFGDKWIEYLVYHHNVKKYIELMKTDKLPDFFVTADKINWKKRVEVQGIISQRIDHSISSTVNLPEGTANSVVSDIYKAAYENDCKGITVYVAGSREDILISEEPPDDEEENNSIKRPKRLPCDIYKITADGNKWVVFIGLMNGKPYEVFCGRPNKIEIDDKTVRGYIEKEGRGKYSVHIGTDQILKDIHAIFTDTQGVITRLISTSLRHNVHVKYVVQQLEKADGSLFSFNKAIARVLKKYIVDGEVENGTTCPNCGQDALIREEGCVKCSNCGHSKCY